ncbi:putative Vps52 / Sac2 family protein/putative vacuolar protein sorting-associated protein 52 [Blumeria hordei DH14]|uniref:Putative Vps52 / Sac2 family protein/putative vacuolar protein sorting-associated protein 52 n=1 Tax=Blumeria graminis f. sp. hordei (strain DH14) TaxID=546991 RepID=N1J9V9_BLUG1|nr:putative Vps52 / Sac2 family protein/putative vacuolar protein sorting-associated protein 52 [Blumeria hordei DH14]
MWLDRLARHSTPSPTPAATFAAHTRKPNHAESTSTSRPPRSSSLTVQTNDAASSLLASRKFNGSGLKHSSSTSDISNPIQVLQEILATSGDRSSNFLCDTKFDQNLDEYFANKFDFEGLSLQELVTTSFDSTDQVQDTNQKAVDCEDDIADLQELHRAICSCDDVLCLVESDLISFQKDLAQVSAEIETLQARSITLNARLENRKITEQVLGPYVEQMSVSPAVVKKIVDGSIDEAWLRALTEVEKRSKALDLKTNDKRNIKGICDLKPLLENLISKALERIRDHIVSQIKVLRSPNINPQVIQQQQFIRFKDIYTFLHKHHPQLAEEIGRAYMNTMRWYFLNQFTRYEKALARIKLHVIEKYDVLGQDDGTRKSATPARPKLTGPSHDAFNMGRRIEILKNPNQIALSSFLAEGDSTSHYIEYLFRNFNLALIDNACAEYSFLTTYFYPALSFPAITRYFNHIFEPTFSLGQALTKSIISDTYDCLGLLICVRLNQHFAFELQRRKMPAMDVYINGTSMLLWPRFQLVMDAHCDSIKTLTATLSSRKPSPSEAAKQSAAPHFLTQRFGQFLQGILELSAEGGDDEPVSTSLGRLRGEMTAFLTRFASVMEDRKRERFLYNNYSLILTIMGEGEGKLAIEQNRYFQEKKNEHEASVK